MQTVGTPEENKRLVRRYVDEVQNGHSIDALSTIFTADFVDHMNAFEGVFHGIEGLEEGYRQLLGAFPGFGATVHVQIAEEDLVATHKTITGTHHNEFRGIPATGRPFEFQIIDIFRVGDDRVTESWGVFDELTFLRQLGAVPPA